MLFTSRGHGGLGVPYLLYITSSPTNPVIYLRQDKNMTGYPWGHKLHALAAYSNWMPFKQRPNVLWSTLLHSLSVWNRLHKKKNLLHLPSSHWHISSHVGRPLGHSPNVLIFCAFGRMLACWVHSQYVAKEQGQEAGPHVLNTELVISCQRAGCPPVNTRPLYVHDAWKARKGGDQ